MKNILKLLSTIAISIVPPTLTLSKISNQTKTFVNSTPKLTKISNINFNYYRMSDTQAILQSMKNDIYFLDVTKVSEPSKGLIPLNKKGYFIRMSDTTGIVVALNSSGMFEKCFLFDSKKVSEPSKGFTDLNIKNVSVFSLSETTVFLNFDDSNENYFLDLTKMDEPSKGLIALNTLNNVAVGTFYRISDTKAIVQNIRGENYFLDFAKIDEPSKVVTKIEKYITQVIPMSDTQVVLIESAKNGGLPAYLLDTTKIDEPSKGLTPLNKDLYNFYYLSPTSAIVREYITSKAYFLDLTKINESSKGFIPLNKKLLDFYRMSDTQAILQDEEYNTYLYNSTKPSEFILLSKCVILFYRLSEHLALFREIVDNGETNNIYFLDLTKINESSKGFIPLNKINLSVEVLSSTTALIEDDGYRTYYVEYN